MPDIKYKLIERGRNDNNEVTYYLLIDNGADVSTIVLTKKQFVNLSKKLFTEAQDM